MSSPVGTRAELVGRALEALRAGRPVLVADSEDREDEVDVILSAALATPAWVGWTVRHSSGYLCAPLPAELADRLDLALMVPRTRDPLRTAYTVSVDAAEGVTTGISAADRTRTLRALAAADAGPEDLIRPGHVLPLRAVPGGVRQRPGHTEAAVDLCRLAGLPPVGMICELVRDDGEVMRRPEAERLAEQNDLVMISIADLVAVLEERAAAETGQPVPVPSATEPDHRVDRVATAALPTSHGALTVHAYRDRRTGAEHLALVGGDVDPGAVTTVRVHSECLTGEALGSLRCDCGPQLDAALDTIVRRGGVVVYLRGHEGRGIGLAEKIAAYALQDAGRDTVTANLELGWPAEAREYGAAAAILADLGVRAVELLTNNPDKSAQLREHGVPVERLTPLVVGVRPENAVYLRTKAEAMGHDLPAELLDPAGPAPSAGPTTSADPTHPSDPTHPDTEGPLS